MALSPTMVQARLNDSVRRLRWSRSGRYLIFGAALSLFILIAALLLDTLLHFGTVGRWIGFWMILLPVVVALAMALRAWRMPISAASIARRIEGLTPDSRNTLISAIQFDRELPPDSALRRALFAEMVDPFPRVQWRDVFDLRLLTRLAIGLGGVVVVLIGGAIASPAHFSNSAARLFLPSRQIAPLTRTQIVSVEPGNTRLVHGSELALRAHVGGQVPRDAWIAFREAGSSWQRRPMNREVGQPVFTFHWPE